MLKEVEERTKLRNIRVLHGTTGLSYEQLFNVLEIPEAEQQRYLDKLKEIETQEDT